MTRKSRTTLTAKTTVRVYAAEQMEMRTCLQWISRFERYLGRPAVLADMSDRTLGAFFESMASLAQTTQGNTQGAVLQIARHAAERNLIPWPAPDWSTRVSLHQAVGDGGGIGLVRYFEERYLPQQGGHLSAETLKTYRKHLRAYERFACTGEKGNGNAAANKRIDRITTRSLAKFREWLTLNGTTERQVKGYASIVATVAKHANPERFIEPQLPVGADASRSLAHVFESLYLPAKPVIASKRTEHLYHMAFNIFGRFLGRVATLDDLSDERVGEFMRHLKTLGKAPATINGYRDKLRAIWEWAARRKLVDAFPTIASLPEPAKIPSAWTQEQLATLFKACGMMPGSVAGIPAADWWRAIHLVSWDTGERTGALFQLRWEMLDLRTRKLVVPAECRKGGRVPMAYSLKRDTVVLLRRLADHGHERILPFDSDPNRGRFYRDYKRLLKLAGLPYVRWKSSLQKMRRSFATHLEAAGGNATKALHHSARSLTEKSYLDPVLIQRAAPNELLFSLTTAGN